MTERLRTPVLLMAAALLAALVFLVDIVAKYDFAISILYLAVLVLVSSAGGERTVLRAAQACVALTILAWTVVHLDQASPASALRSLFACIAIGVTAALLVSRKRLEAIRRDLDRSRSEVELFANSVPFVLWRSNPEGEIEYLNESWTAVTGLDRWSVLKDQRYNDVVHPGDIPALNESVSYAVATRTMTNLKIRVRQRDSSYRWMQIYDSPAFSPITGKVERFGGLSDVHDEVVAKEELQKVQCELEASRAELVNITDSVPQILWRADARGTLDFYNRRYPELTGRQFGERVERDDYLADFHPEDRETFVSLLERAMAAGTELRTMYRLRHADGSYRWMSHVGRPVPVVEGSDELRWYGGLSDIHEEVSAHQKVRELNETLEQRVTERTSELMRTERRYSGLFDVSNMTFAEMDFSAAERILDDLKGRGVIDLRAYMTAHADELARTLAVVRTTRVNDALARMMGYESVAELVANPPAQNADDGPEVLLRQLEMYFDGLGHIDGRTVLVGKGGRRIPVYFTVTRLPDGLHLSSHVDLSEQERIEGMRRAAQAELARANRIATVGAFSASIAHELNQPIASMLMDASTGLRLVGRENPDFEAISRILQRVDKTAERIAGIVQRTRNSIVAGRPATKAIDVCRLAKETRDLLRDDLSRAGADLQIACVEGVPSIMGDPIEVQQVLVNLVNNAADAMRDQPGHRRITMEITAEAAAVRIQVADSGPGIPDEHLSRLFDPFFTTKSTGIGMGLNICRATVEAMGGQLTVRNLPSGGASFAFELPRADPDLARGA
ncbi:PAS domain-containing protein [Sphingomonas sp. NBWT7]|uniref:PAS domain-containing sensor histidine kinase n=1 Tax=Sphingomonas sp. NBWT7 TaxID=2596913 RepID=UPI00185FE032|nr:ATP-binding protein [Sphingomonas sp. NBWT7]QNE31083.1 PAS domain-containing protein [Sphingomonas sp. NBWT7]